VSCPLWLRATKAAMRACECASAREEEAASVFAIWVVIPILLDISSKGEYIMGGMIFRLSIASSQKLQCWGSVGVLGSAICICTPRPMLMNRSKEARVEKLRSGGMGESCMVRNCVS
jgi:hypothetical protein